jgi:transposase
MMDTHTTLVVGIDIAATSVAVASMRSHGRASRPQTFAQTAQGMAALHQHLQGITSPAETCVVMEATGSYWITLATTLHEWGYRVSVINPAQAHYFTKALLKRAKTDGVDAQTLAQLGTMLNPAPWTPPPAVYAEIYQRLMHRDNLVDIRVQLRNQLHALTQLPQVVESVRTNLENLIAMLTSQIDALEKEIAAALKVDDRWAQAAARLQSIPGIGLLTAAWLLAITVNFTTCASPESLVSYVGLAPQPFESGSSVYRRPRIGHEGQKRLRTALYMAAVAASRWNPATQPLYARLRAAGKPGKLALCAVARKLIHIAWAVVTKEQMFKPPVPPVCVEGAVSALPSPV